LDSSTAPDRAKRELPAFAAFSGQDSDPVLFDLSLLYQLSINLDKSDKLG
jgi:hypothetical protein